MNNVLGLCNLHDAPHLGNLTNNHPLGAITFLGRYALMDFTLSNFSNSGIDKVGILVDQGVSAISKHVANGQVWITNTRTGFQKIIYNEKGNASKKFNTDINNVLSNSQIFDDIDYEYVVIAPSFFLTKMDYRPYLEAHKNSHKEISTIYIHTNYADKEFINCDCIEVRNGTVKSFGINSGTKKSNNISLEMFIMDRKTFHEMVLESRNISTLFGIRQMVAYYANNSIKEINAIEHKGYVVPMLSFNNYVNYSLAMLEYSTRQKLLFDDWPIYTTTHNTPPTLYGESAEVSNAFIANGSIIKGKVTNSIISRDVTIEEGAVVENCILFTKTVISKGTELKYVLTDKHVSVNQVKKLKGDKEEYLYIDSGAKI